MKPVFRRPSLIIKQFSGLTANQDKATKSQPIRFMQQHNALQV
ncbi:transposase [Neisseria sp. HMSC058F07]|nr:transposase [Neisseria sp. HMSC058F07]